MTVMVVTQKALEELDNELRKQSKDKSHVVKLMEYYAKFNLIKMIPMLPSEEGNPRYEVEILSNEDPTPEINTKDPCVMYSIISFKNKNMRLFLRGIDFYLDIKFNETNEKKDNKIVSVLKKAVRKKKAIDKKNKETGEGFDFYSSKVRIEAKEIANVRDSLRIFLKEFKCKELLDLLFFSNKSEISYKREVYASDLRKGKIKELTIQDISFLFDPNKKKWIEQCD